MKKRVQFYEDKKGEHRVRIVGKGTRQQTLLIAAEGYKNKADLRKALRSAFGALLAHYFGR